MSKLKAGQVAVWSTRTLMDVVGPFASTAQCPLEKWFRDAKIYELFEGTAEIQRLVISRMQVSEYRERLLEAAAIAAEATEPKLGSSVAAAQ
jgi:alkylation response protein AidB-like acyl-CoA dehydrogenase